MRADGVFMDMDADVVAGGPSDGSQGIRFMMRAGMRGWRRRRQPVAMLGLVVVAAAAGCHSPEGFLRNRLIEPFKIFDKWGPTAESRRVVDSNGHLGVRPRVPEPRLPIYGADALVEDTADKRLYYTCQYIEPKALKKILSEQIPGLVMSVNEASNQLVIGDQSWSKVEQIKRLVAKMDRVPPQVRIDALIEEVFADMTEDYSIDVDWSYGGEDHDVLIDYTLPGASVRWPARVDEGFGVDLKNVTGQHTDIHLILNFLRSEGMARDLYRPSLLVANRQTASVESKESIPIVEEIIQGSNTIKVRKYKDISTRLEVTPTVLSDNRVSLKYKIQIASTKPEGPEQAPTIATKSTDVKETILRHGESLIVAGILYRKRVDIIRAVPILGEIPVLDLVFSSKDHEDRWLEIVFVLTPYIVSSEGKSPLRFRAPHQAYPGSPYSDH